MECMQLWMSFDYVHDMIQRQVPLNSFFSTILSLAKMLMMAMKVDQKMILKR
jgi:hypothetical protein